MLRTSLGNFAAAVALVLSVGAAHAALFNGSYTVTANTNDAVGLGVTTLNDFGAATANPAINTFTGLNVSIGGSHFDLLFDLFATDESPPYSGAALTPRPITVQFNFTSPAGGASGTITGTTVGSASTTDLDALVLWTGPLELIFNDRTVLDIALGNTTFSDSFNGTVPVEFDARIPEPGTLALLGVGLLGGVLVRRKRLAA